MGTVIPVLFIQVMSYIEDFLKLLLRIKISYIL